MGLVCGRVFLPVFSVLPVVVSPVFGVFVRRRVQPFLFVLPVSVFAYFVVVGSMRCWGLFIIVVSFSIVSALVVVVAV